MSGALPYAHGSPPASGVLRAEPADFRVDEQLGFEPSGSGEHAFVVVEKSGANTEWVARELARAAGVAPLAVGFAGLKDRHAVTRQAFTVQLAGRADPDWSSLAIDGVRVLSATRHNRKLKRGAHRGNRFRIVLRGVRGEREAMEQRLATIAARGVPNYFGEQRFGRDGGNLALAARLFAGERMPRERRGIALSAARSELFNAVLAARVERGDWDRALDGEVWMLDGTHAIFGPEPFTDELARRLAAFDIHPTGPLWGRGELRTRGDVAVLERNATASHGGLADGLERAGLEQERRSLRLRAAGLAYAWEAPDRLVVEFGLGAGSFATTVLRELCDWHAAMA
ncbi:MAG: tRNA pseudouridine(13) synthase TruD [Dokdonella sp.]|uniref:tRNA pseudouridine(13) synthase TruD n=1 Tax=Dokdonella sp. TaxID=2291710 RepID=UPI003F8118DA